MFFISFLVAVDWVLLSNTGLPVIGRPFPCPGYAWDGTACAACPPGQFSRFGDGACRECPLGRFSNATGAAKCAECSAGTFAATVGRTACVACDAGRYAASSGTERCFSCLPGAYAPETVRIVLRLLWGCCGFFVLGCMWIAVGWLLDLHAKSVAHRLSYLLHQRRG